MKTLYKDFKMFVGVSALKNVALCIGAFAIVILALSAGNALLWNNADFVNGLLYSIRLVFAFFGSSPIFTISSYSLPQTVGYKLFHYAPDGAARYRNALLFGNIAAAVCMAFSTAVIAVGDFICSGTIDASALLMPLSLGMIIVGTLDIFGCIGNLIARLVGLMIMCSACGFVVGLLEDYVNFWMVLLAAGAVIWAAGIVYIILAAKKQWNKER